MTDYPFSQPDRSRRGVVDGVTIDGVQQKNLLQQLAEQCGRDSQKYFPDVESAKGTSYGRLLHDAAACSSEAGELLEIVKKIDRGSLDYDTEGVRAALEGEAVDVLIYLMNIFFDLGIDPLRAFMKKREYNNLRFNREKK